MNDKKNLRLELFIVMALVLLTAAVYGQVRNFDFVNYDDHHYVRDNVMVQKALTWQGVQWAFTTTTMANWHPLTWLSYMLDVQLFGLSPGACHLVNVLFHLLNSILLFLVLRRMTGARWRSACVAALFALHPLHVESVAWLAERKDVLSTFFWMLSMGAYVLYSEQRSLKRYLPVLFFFSLGLMAKPMLVTLPVILLLMDYWPLGRLRWKPPEPAAPAAASAAPEKHRKKRRQQPQEQKKPPPPRDVDKGGPVLSLVLEKIPLFALSAASSVITFYAQHKAGAVASLSAVPLPDRIANALVSYAAYLWKMFWPAGLAVFYPFGALSPAVVLASVFLLLAMTFVAVRWTDRHPYLLVGWLWYLITLLPVIGIIKVGDAAMADRYTYITLTGPFIALAWGAFDLSQALRFPRTALAAASALVLSILILVTYTQVGQWRDGITLFRHTLSVTSGNYVAHYCLAMVYLNKKNYAEALSNLKSALGINPNYTAAYGGMGEALIYQNRFDEALHYTSRAIESQPQNEKLRNQAGFILIRLRRIDEAITQFETAVRLAPDYARAHNNLGGALMEKNRVEEAILQFETAIRLDPGNSSARENLKYALAQRKEVKKSGR